MSVPSYLPLTSDLDNALKQLEERNKFGVYNPSFGPWQMNQPTIPIVIVPTPYNPTMPTSFGNQIPIAAPPAINLIQFDQQAFLAKNFNANPNSLPPVSYTASDYVKNYQFFGDTNLSLSEYYQHQAMQSLLQPGSPIMSTLGVPNSQLLFTKPFFNVNATDSMEVFKQKTDLICSQIEQNKSFWKQTFNECLPISSEVANSKWASELDMHTKRSFITGEGYTSEEQVELVIERIKDVQAESEEMRIENEKYAFLTDVADADNQGVQTVPYAEKVETNQNGFQQALEDRKHIEIFKRNHVLYPEGSEERLPDDYLEKNLKGLPNTVGGNFGYFAGSFFDHLSGYGLVKADSNFSFSEGQGSNQLLKTTPDNPVGSSKSLFLDTVKDKFTGIAEDTKKYWKYRWDIISNLDVSEFLKHETIFTKNSIRGSQDAYTMWNYLNKKSDPNVSTQEAEDYLNTNLKGYTDDIGGKTAYTLTQLLLTAAALRVLTGGGAFAGAFDQGSKIGPKIGSQLINTSRFNELIKTFSPAVQKQVLQNSWKFLSLGTQNFLETCPSGFFPIAGAAFKVASGFAKPPPKGSKVGNVLQVEELAQAEGFNVYHTHLQGVSASEALLSARNALDLSGRTGKIGENLKFLKLDQANRIYCHQNVPDKAIAEKVIEANRPIQRHHFLSDKSIKSGNTEIYKEFLDEMGLKLNDSMNLWNMPHFGSHPIPMHRWTLEQIDVIREIAGNDTALKIKLFEEMIKKPIIENPRMLDADWWKEQEHVW